MPSSTSSSDIFYREIPEQPWPRLIAVAAVLVVIAMAGWESLARSMYHIPGTYQGFSDMWAVERRKLDEPNDIRVVLTGSSRMLWDSDLDIMEEGFGTRPLQLAIPGTSPALFVEDIVNNTDFDGLMLVGISPFLFNRLDEGAFGGAALEFHRDESPSHRSGMLIHNFLSEYFAFLDDGFAMFDLVNRYTNLPERPGSFALMEEEWKLGDFYPGRQTNMWPPIEVVGSFDNTQITNFWMPGLRRPPEEPERMAEMATDTLAFFAPLVEKFRARGGDMVFIRMPGGGLYDEHVLKTDYDGLTWQPMAEGFGAPAFNSMDYPQLSSELDIPEWSHLSRDSQDRWSRDMMPILRQIYLEYRGFPIDEIIDPAG